MVGVRIYIEGGGDSKELHARCREAFRHLLEAIGLAGRMPRLVACGSRNETFDDFKKAHGDTRDGHFVAMFIDSEDPMEDIEKPWAHLKQRDHWDRPDGAEDTQVIVMVTCMETWIVTDRQALESYFGQGLQLNALPALDSMETRDRNSIQNALSRATRDCKKQYTKGKTSFEVLATLDPVELRGRLPSFKRCERILKDNLMPPV